MSKTNVKIDILDKQGEVSILLKSLGFDIPKAELELMLNALRWHRMGEKDLECPQMTIKNIKVFKDDHYDFIVQHVNKQREEAQAKEKAPLEVVKE